MKLGYNKIKSLLMAYGLSVMLLLSFVMNCYANDASDINSETPLPDLSTGILTHSVPIKVPFGRKGMNPKLELLYRSSNRNGPVGMGWELEVGSIEVKNAASNGNGTTVYRYRRAGSVEDLVDLVSGQYSPAIDSGEFNRISFVTTNGQSYWEVINKRGTVFRFGSSSESRQYDSAHPDKIVKWCLDRVQDTDGNYMTFSYKNGGTNGLILLDKIEYTGNDALAPSNRVNFIYENRDDAENLYTTGFSMFINQGSSTN